MEFWEKFEEDRVVGSVTGLKPNDGFIFLENPFEGNWVESWFEIPFDFAFNFPLKIVKFWIK